MQYPTRTGPIVNDQAAFTPSMSAGCLPERNRERLGPRIPLPISQTTHTAAGVSVEMFAGQQPRFRVRSAPFTSGFTLQPADVTVFTIEHVQGSVPWGPRIRLGPRIGQPLAQTTHTAAGISIEMFAGQVAGVRTRWQPYSTGWTVPPPDVTGFTIEHVQGSLPSMPRIRLGPRIGLPISQTTHTAAAFSVEMSAGSQPVANRAWRQPKLGWTSNTQMTPVSAPFGPEMVQGWQPYSARPARPIGYGFPIYTPETIATVIVVPRPITARASRGTAIGVSAAVATRPSVRGNVVSWLVTGATSTTPRARTMRGNSISAPAGEV